VRSACLLTAGDTHLAEDLVQTALARLYVAWPRMRKAGTESGYVWRNIVNAHIDEVRRPARRRERHVPELPEAPAPPEAVTDSPGGGEVRAALAALPPGMRAAVVLRPWLDLSVGETVELLNCSEGTVKSQIAKATARLRDLLSPAAVERTHR
jgi:RNA polymerase sigma-70 factor (sigma-E family)